ncbi:phage/plasmid primase, P4 family [Mycobacteroides abscessus]|uniref:Phage/plasmid primase, P4 family, C-terminal domain n=1 Tax=Mycobacteroides abscessus subsp. abscessus TaxID=1185650 RepID=A0AB38D8E4_9MYCO|nr:phage/plasmid primase, P4 family [Mycobacteroides abscessus]SIC22307.1 phage/plasmid primase, P4 family, C-terminal domain [Mycobacteroides abscessus subsp. abscessus]SIC25132.1 phage/plasmid primase, P4 family, C-terminal domain [Mycobacteroides abscessus subsp. abscessus]SIC34313.1 phage/plasmid primase, P4 family, C-terminal domain [Mycobacteroides abscessus subsp. abscessus]SIC42104.1 phage/plasmid primase, P4 family, C-terminal domain [Mycobacteroides abscessus subsp. abscessus]SKR8425
MNDTSSVTLDSAAVEDKSAALPGEPLTEEHLSYLKDQGIDPEYLALPHVADSLRSITDFDQLSDGFRWVVDRDSAGGIIFGWGLDGETPQFRPDLPRMDVDGTPIAPKYVFAKGSSASVVLRSNPETADMVGIPLLLVEGTKQSLAAGSALRDQDIAVAGMPGCHGYKQNKVVSPELVQLVKGKTEIVIALDGDARSNRNVYDAGIALKKTLARRNRTVRFVQLPEVAEDEHTGLDDYLSTITPEDRESVLLGLMEAALPEPALERPAAKVAEGSPDSFFSLSGALLADKVASTILATHNILLEPLTFELAEYVESEGIYRIHPDSKRSPTVKNACIGLLGYRYHDRHAPTVESVVRKELEARGLFVTPPEGAWVHVRNGWLNWKTLEFEGHSPERRSLYKLNVNYVPGATCPRVNEFLMKATTLADGENQVPQMWDTASQLLDSRTPTKALSLAGPPRSGKGTFSRLLEAMVPDELVDSVGLLALSDDSHASASLYGKKLNVIGEMEQVYVADTSTFNKAFGEDPIKANPKYRAMFSFRNTALWVMLQNELPQISDPSGAFVSRLTPIQFGESYVGREDRGLGKRLLSELPGVLNELIDALRARDARGGAFLEGHPEVVAHFAEGTNPLMQFWKECIQVAPDDVWATGDKKTVPKEWLSNASTIHTAYKSHCERTGRKARHQGRLMSALEATPFGLRRARAEGNFTGYACKLRTPGAASPGLEGAIQFRPSAGRVNIDKETGELLVLLNGATEPLRFPAPAGVPTDVNTDRAESSGELAPPSVTGTSAPGESAAPEPEPTVEQAEQVEEPSEIPAVLPIPAFSTALQAVIESGAATVGHSTVGELLRTASRTNWARSTVLDYLMKAAPKELRAGGAGDDQVAEFLGVIRGLLDQNPLYRETAGASR